MASARNVSFGVESPGPTRRIESQRVDRNGNLGGPAIARASDVRLPDTVPVEGNILRIDDETVGARAGSVDPKVVTRALISKRVENEPDGVVARHVAVALHGMHTDVARIGIPAGESEIDAFVVREDAQGCVIRRRFSGMG